MKDTKEVFENVYINYFSKVFAYFSLCFGTSAAEDLAQQVFLKLWKYLLCEPNFEPQNWRAWIFRAAVNVKNDYLRTKQSKPQFFEYSDFMESGNHMQADEITESMAIRQAFERLSAADKELLILKRMGLHSEEIGTSLGLHSSTVRSRLAAAKERFNRHLIECGVNADG